MPRVLGGTQDIRWISDRFQADFWLISGRYLVDIWIMGIGFYTPGGNQNPRSYPKGQIYFIWGTLSFILIRPKQYLGLKNVFVEFRSPPFLLPSSALPPPLLYSYLPQLHGFLPPPPQVIFKSGECMGFCLPHPSAPRPLSITGPK